MESLLVTVTAQEVSLALSVVLYRIATSFILPLAGQSFFEERTMGDKTGGSLSVTVTVKDSYIKVSNKPGIGVDLNLEAMKKYATQNVPFFA